jgi:hypothetical protein
MGKPEMDEENSDWFSVHRAPNGKFYSDTAGRSHLYAHRRVSLFREREALEFLAEIGDIVLH